jgi:hypothetical protein
LGDDALDRWRRNISNSNGGFTDATIGSGTVTLAARQSMLNLPAAPSSLGSTSH